MDSVFDQVLEHKDKLTLTNTTKKASIKKPVAKKRSSMSVFNMSPFGGSGKKREVKRTTSVLSYGSISNMKGVGDKKGANSFVISNQGSNSSSVNSDELSYDGIPVTIDIGDETENHTPLQTMQNVVPNKTPAQKMKDQLALGILSDLGSVNKKEQRKLTQY
jgi:hypothetical protein